MNRESLHTLSSINPTMTVIINRDLRIVWADLEAKNYFGQEIIDRPCHEVLGGTMASCEECIVTACFKDHCEHVREMEVELEPHRRRTLRRTAKPAELSPEGTLLLVKEVIEDVTEIRTFERLMEEVEMDIGGRIGIHLFRIAVLKLCRLLKADQLFIGEFLQQYERIRTVVHCGCRKARMFDNFEYSVAQAPCRNLLDHPRWIYNGDVAAQFPEWAPVLIGAKQSYMGFRLDDSRGKALGVLVALCARPVSNAAFAEAMLQLFAERFAVELETIRIHRVLENYRHIVSTAHDQLALIDTHYLHQAVNPVYASFHGLTVEEAVGKSMREVMGADFFENVIQPAAEKCLQGHKTQLQAWYSQAGETERCFEMGFYPHHEKGGNRIIGFVFGAKDVTRRKRLETDLQQTYKMETIGKLASGIAHDFNNILGAMVGYTDLALSQLKGQKEVAKCLHEIQKAGLRASELIKQILTFSRQKGQALQAVQPKMVLTEALRLLRATIPATIRMETEILSEAFVLAEPTQLHQIIINLCANAHFAMREQGGVLTVRLVDIELSPSEAGRYPGMPPGPYMHLSVSDTGRGIPAEIQAKIFDPFFTTKEKGEGTGMGLTMVQSIVRSYHGMISFESEMGKGTTFNILLPVVEAGEDDPAVSQPILAKGSERILVVDDERVLAEMTRSMLVSLGYQVTALSSSQKALELFESDPQAFDLVFADVSMPEISGDDLARRMLRLRPDLPIILMTGFSNRLNHENTRQMGVRRLLYKPLTLQKISRNVREVLDHQDDL